MGPPPDDPAALIEKAKEAADDFVRRLGERDFDGVEQEASEYVARLGELRLEGDDAYERLVRIRGTAARLLVRERAEEAFAKLRIDVRGIIWEQDGAAALVNGSSVRKGDVVKGARVEEIRRDAVIFEFQGVLVRKVVR